MMRAVMCVVSMLFLRSDNRDPYHQDPAGFEFQIRNTLNFLFETGYLVSPPVGSTNGPHFSATST